MLGGKYLGMPRLVGRRKREAFNFLKDRLWQKIDVWKRRKLSKAGKEILIKSVALALPNFVMGLFLLPKELCDELQKILNSYWWCDARAQGGIKWRSWENMSVKKCEGGMGFKNLYDFNLALLGKQCWRCLSHPDCLMAQVLRAKYFKDGSLLEAKCGSNASIIWRSIWRAMEVFKPGLRRMIGDGETTLVWKDPWLPSDHNPYVESPERNAGGMKVADLFLPGEKQWNIDLIESLFNERDEQMILSTPLGRVASDDCWVWKQERNGIYSVKSGYTFLHQSRGRGSSDTDLAFWKKIWSLQALPKMVHFLWLTLSNCLPTRESLAARHVRLDSLTCPVCGSAVETTIHIFAECVCAIQVWSIAGLRGFSGDGHDIKSWFGYILQSLERKQWALVVALCWALWNHRNEVVWQNRFSSAWMIYVRGTTLLNNWVDACKVEVNVETCEMMAAINSCWSKPDEGWLKVNVDAACISGAGAIGVVCRDSSSSFIAGLTRRFRELKDPATLEAMDIREALSWIKENKLRRVVVESDSVIAVTAINLKDQPCSFFGSVISDCISIMTTFDCVRVVYVRRTANDAAHVLARAACSLPDRSYWGRQPPDCIVSAIAADSSN